VSARKQATGPREIGKPVTVIGGGSWGTALADVLSGNGHSVLVWARDPDFCKQVNETRSNERYLPSLKLPPKVTFTADMARAARHSRLILLVVPSHGFRAIARSLGDHLTGEHIVVHGTKGIEQGTQKRMCEVLREETCVRRLGVLTGPNLAAEIAAGQPAGTLVASHFSEVQAAALEVLHCHRFRVYTATDVIGAEVAGAFKNIVALAAGVVDGLGLGDNTRALLLTRGLNEMARVGAAMGADIHTFGGLAGIGDLMATCSSPLSRNHQVGERLAKGETLEGIQSAMRMVAEGVKTTGAVHAFARAKGLDLPIVAAVHRVLDEGQPVAEALADLMALPPSPELAGLDW
jgi:glycerol-3-phosphate dehydrogenase (NAD(P)+)